ncbi:hypothetical protein EDB92DRAFT_1822439 [Lactarius akahatsu]|uniref:Uncharacterized protein n=1 Tax=Lactarius akahatsu TaxID=416441 RepID=A0AAD4Q748_9AGAM|nr:hypothetical protein EDB92DRAFT_1822439 [Lactarius akahatsu]
MDMIEGGLKELRTGGRANDFGLAYLNFDIVDTGYIDADFVGKRVRFDSDPENNISRGVVVIVDVANTDDIGAGPVHPLRMQDGVYLQSKVILLDVTDLMLPHDSELPKPGVRLRAGGFLPWSAGASDQAWSGGQASIRHRKEEGQTRSLVQEGSRGKKQRGVIETGNCGKPLVGDPLFSVPIVCSGRTAQMSGSTSMTSKSKTWEVAECRRMVPRFHDEVLFCGNKDAVKGWMYGKSAQLGRRSLSGRRGAGAGARAHRRPIPASLTSNTERTEQPRVGALHDASYYARYTFAVSVTVMEGPEELRSLAEEDCDDDTSMDDDLMTISRDRQSFPSNAHTCPTRDVSARVYSTLPAQSNTDSIHDMIALEAALTRPSEVEGSREEKGRKGSGRCVWAPRPVVVVEERRNSH